MGPGELRGVVDGAGSVLLWPSVVGTFPRGVRGNCASKLRPPQPHAAPHPFPWAQLWAFAASA